MDYILLTNDTVGFDEDVLDEEDFLAEEDLESDLEISEKSESSDYDESSSEDEDNVCFNSDVLNDCWSDKTAPVEVDDFLENIGPIHGLPENAKPFDYFSLIVNEEFYQLAADQTNLYAVQRQEKAGKEDTYWVPVSAVDIKLFLHINIMMGIVDAADYNMYWRQWSSYPLDEPVLFVARRGLMDQSRFEKISQYFHLNDSSKQHPKGHKDHDPLHKVRPFLDMVKSNIASCFSPGRDISIDKATIAFSGHLYFKQYNLNMRYPSGMHVSCAADCATGYLLDLDFSVGKVEDPMPHGLGHYVVTKLGRPFFGKNHHFFYDDYFSSVQLARDLLQEKTYSCSMIRPNSSGWPADCRPKATNGMKKCTVKFRQQGNTVATVWRDKRIITILSTNTSPEMTNISYPVRGGTKIEQMPSTLVAFSNSVDEVDRFEQMYSLYPVDRTSNKWWKHVFRFLLQTAIVNSFIIYSTSHRPHPKTKDVDHAHFRSSLCLALRKGIRKRKATKQPATEGLMNDNQLDHRLVRLTDNDTRCFWCSKNRQYGVRRGKTVYRCNPCDIRLNR